MYTQEDNVRSAMHQTRSQVIKIRNKIDQIESANLEKSLFPSQKKIRGKIAVTGAKFAGNSAASTGKRQARPSILSQMPHVSEVDGREVDEKNGGKGASFGAKKIPRVVARYAAAYQAAEKRQEEVYKSHMKLWRMQQQVRYVCVCVCVCYKSHMKLWRMQQQVRYVCVCVCVCVTNHI